MEHAGKTVRTVFPLLKKLKWREFIGVKCLWGTLTDKNNPLLPQNANDPTLMMFPGHYDAEGYIIHPVT